MQIDFSLNEAELRNDGTGKVIFKSKQVNLDKKPWVYALLGEATENFTPAREAEQVTGGFVYDPRPELEATRDPQPWLEASRGAWRHEHFLGPLTDGKAFVIWSPRRDEFDNPVNEILRQFRGDVTLNPTVPVSELAVQWLAHEVGEFSDPHEIDHATKVLTRLAGQSK